jgi:hypothetical protein
MQTGGTPLTPNSTTLQTIAGLSEIRTSSAEALDAIKRHFPQELFQWQQVHARHLIGGVRELNLIATAADAQRLAANAAELLLPITKYWQKQAETFGKLSKGFADLYENACPPNLRGLTFEEIVTVIRAAQSQRLGVVHSLPSSLVKTLLDNPEVQYEEFTNLLLNSSPAIFECIKRELRTVTKHDQLGNRATLLLEALDCHLDGYFAGSQSLAISVLDSHLLDIEPLSAKSKDTTSKQIRERADQLNIDDLEILNGCARFY